MSLSDSSLPNSSLLPGYRSPVYRVTAALALEVSDKLFELLGDYQALGEISAEFLRLKKHQWAAALWVDGLEKVLPNTLLLLATYQTDEIDAIANGLAKAEAYFVDKELSYGEVSALTLRNLYFIHERQYAAIKKGTPLGLEFYYAQLAFIAFYSLAWSRLSSNPDATPVAKISQLRFS